MRARCRYPGLRPNSLVLSTNPGASPNVIAPSMLDRDVTQAALLEPVGLPFAPRSHRTIRALAGFGELTPPRSSLYSAVISEFGELLRSRLIEEMRSGRSGGFTCGT